MTKGCGDEFDRAIGGGERRGRGLGAATCGRPAELRVHVVVFDSNKGEAEAVASAIAAAQRRGIFSIAVNAAGALAPTTPMATMEGVPHDMGVFKDMMAIHLLGPFNVARLAAAAFAGNPPDADGQRGVIINTSSTAAYEGQASQATNSAAKAGIVGLTRAMARDLADLGVQVCAIAPGPISTPRLEAGADRQRRLSKAIGASVGICVPGGGHLAPPFLSGQTIRLDGALSTPRVAMS